MKAKELGEVITVESLVAKYGRDVHVDASKGQQE
jgi:hypothetical protein